jgi:dipeptidyl aminopeptidase/acylaminoacyl peptidase
LATVADDGTVWVLEDFDCALIAGLAPLDDEVVVVSASASELLSVKQVNTITAETVVHRHPSDLGVDSTWFSQAEAISFPSGSGRTSHAFFYPPTGPSLEGSAGELPPLVVMGHGGPTSHATPGLSLKVQYWTSRGFGVVDVNYGGSTGFGTDYRRLLNGQWGIVDVEDVISAASFLASAGRVDPDRIAIRGGSAGGFTVLAALEQSDIFAAGTSLYGVADLKALAEDTHKFESRYLDTMIGPWPEAQDVYEERSPINHTDGLSSPLLVMQGSEDEVVPPSQSEAIVAAVAAKGIPHAYLVFEGEQHGFRQAPNVIRSFEAELWFYGYVFGFEPADDIEPVPIQP